MRGKRVLLFAPKFFNYENYIKEEIERQGGIVHLYDERNHPSAVEKIIFRKAHFLLKRKALSFYRRICDVERQFQPDYIAFINPEMVDNDALALLKERFPGSKFLIYMWDSCKNKRVKHLFGQFDLKYSFDMDDCMRYGLNFRPLFYLKEFEGRRNTGNTEFSYDVSFIGTVHSDRIKIIEEIKAFCDANRLQYYFYLFVPGKLMFVLRWILSSSFRKFEKKYVHFEPLQQAEISKITEASRCVIDINHPKQTGLTMRTLEMLGMNKKIMTTNANVKRYDFYRPENQIVFERGMASFDVSELKHEYKEIPKEVYEKYSLASWVRHIFEISENEYGL